MERNRRLSSSAKASSRPGRLGRGFTLIELIAVLVIVGIAAAIVVPMVSNTGDINASAGARKLTSDLMYAQNYAITHQTRVRVTFSADGTTYTLSQVPAVGSPVTMTEPVTKKQYVTTLSTISGLSRVSLANVAFPTAGLLTVEFDSLGAPTPAQGGTVQVTSGGMTRTVTVMPVTGRINVQ